MLNRYRTVGLAFVMMTGLAVAAEQPTGRTDAAVGPRVDGASTTGLTDLIVRQGLLDPARLTTWRSYSFGMTTGGSQTQSAGLLIQHLQYQISKPLTLYMEVGLLHNPLGMAGMRTGGPSQASLVIPAFDLTYRPREDMAFSIHFSQMPRSYGTPWWYGPSDSRR